MNKTTKIILVRHGESIANAEGVSQGNKDEWIDTHLSKKGKEQADKVAQRLKNEKIDIIYSSDLKRAKETAEAINKFHNVNIKKSLSSLHTKVWSLFRLLDAQSVHTLKGVVLNKHFDITNPATARIAKSINKPR